MIKGQQKLYQNGTPKEIIKNLEKFIKFFEEEAGITPIALKAAIEYIYLHKEREKNAKKKKNNINTNGGNPVQ